MGRVRTVASGMPMACAIARELNASTMVRANQAMRARKAFSSGLFPDRLSIEFQKSFLHNVLGVGIAQNGKATRKTNRNGARPRR